MATFHKKFQRCEQIDKAFYRTFLDNPLAITPSVLTVVTECKMLFWSFFTHRSFLFGYRHSYWNSEFLIFAFENSFLRKRIVDLIKIWTSLVLDRLLFFSDPIYIDFIASWGFVSSKPVSFEPPFIDLIYHYIKLCFRKILLKTSRKELRTNIKSLTNRTL